MAQASTTEKPRTIGNIEKRYLARTPKSREFGLRAERVMPGGETRSLFHEPYSLCLDRGEGVRCWDIDNNEYLDLGNNYTVLIHGHRFPPIMEAVAKQLEKGNTWAAKCVAQAELAELLVDRFEAVDKIRFSNSGTEAVLSALAVARAYTGKRKVLMSRYSFHGHLLEPSRFAAAVGDEFDRSGSWLDCHLGTFGDAESFEKILKAHGDEICCVMLEPVLGLGGCVTAPKEFFDRVKAAAHKAGAIFILDEATVHRVSPGGSQRAIGITADVSVLGKLVGGGFPCGTIGGTDEVMEVLDPRNGTHPIVRHLFGQSGVHDRRCSGDQTLHRRSGDPHGTPDGPDRGWTEEIGGKVRPALQHGAHGQPDAALFPEDAAHREPAPHRRCVCRQVPTRLHDQRPVRGDAYCHQYLQRRHRSGYRRDHPALRQVPGRYRRGSVTPLLLTHPRSKPTF
jgi:hypothetical protein